MLSEFVLDEYMADGLNQEVEKRALLERSDYESILGRLTELGAERVKKLGVNDVYFCPNATKSFDELEMNDVGSYSLRIRKQTEEEVTKTTINVKIITQKGDHNSWEEHETGVGSAEEVADIFKAMGFKPFCTINKTRDVYRLEDAKLFLEDIEGFGLGIEAEIMTTKEKGETAKAEIDRIFGSLGIPEDKVVKKSITNLIMRLHSKF